MFPVLMVILGGIIQFGIIFWGQNTLNQVVRDTGRWAATWPACNTAAAELEIESTANDIATKSSLIGYVAGGITPAELTVAWRTEPSTGSEPCPPLDNQDEAWVSITIEHQVPIFFPLLPGNGVISSNTEFRMEPEPL